VPVFLWRIASRFRETPFDLLLAGIASALLVINDRKYALVKI